MTHLRRAAGLALVSMAISAVSCSDDDPTGSGGSIAISASSGTATVATGGSTFINVTIQRLDGFDGSVRLAISNLPTGVSATMDPADLPPGTTTARIDLAAAPNATLGAASVTIAASAPNVHPASTVVMLTVTTFALNVSPVTLTVPTGTSKSATIQIDRQGYTAPLALALFGAPAGVQATFSPQPASAGSTTMTVTVGANVAPGNHAVRVGEATHTPAVAAAFQLVVVAAPSDVHMIEFTYCDPAQTPVFFAYQDQGGPWQPVTGVTGNGVTRFGFSFTSAQNHGGVMAILTSPSGLAPRLPSMRARTRHSPTEGTARRPKSASATGDTYSTVVLYGSAQDLQLEGLGTCAATVPTRSVRGTVNGVGAGAYAVVSLGGISDLFDGASSRNPVVFDGVQSGLVDFVGSRITNPGQAPDRAVIFRDLNPADGGALPSAIDFAGGNSFVPPSANVTITGAGGHDLEVFNEVITGTSWMLLWSDLAPSSTTTRPWVGLNAANTRPGDFHGIVVFASSPDGSDDFRVANKYVGPVANQTIQIGAEVPAATVTDLTTGSMPRYRFQGALPSDYHAIGIHVALDGGNDLSMLASKNYLAKVGSIQSYNLVMPDVANLSGFPAAARLSGGNNTVTTDAFGFNSAGAFDLDVALGAEFRASVRVRMLVVP